MPVNDSDTPAAPPAIFISYSHRDDKIWKDRLITHLRSLGSEVEVWSDDKIGLSQDWKAEIEAAIARSSVAVLLMSANFIVSDFIREEEMPRFLARRAQGVLEIAPIIVWPCGWRRYPPFKGLTIETRPKGRALLLRSDGTPATEVEVDNDLTHITDAIEELLRKVPAKSPLCQTPPPTMDGSARLAAANTPSGTQPTVNLPVAQAATETDTAVRAVTDTAVAAGEADLLTVFQNEFRDASDTIAAITGFKAMHDELHTFERGAFVGLLASCNGIGTDDSAVQRLRLSTADLQEAVHQIRASAEILPRVPRVTVFINKLTQAHALLAEAVRNRNPAPASAALALLNATLDTLPELLNDQIVAHTERLDLAPVQRALEVIRVRIAACQSIPQEQLDELRGNIAATEQVETEFRTLVKAHDGWQKVEQHLRTIETTICYSSAVLNMLWPEVYEQVRVLLSGVKTAWADKVHKAATMLTGTISPDQPERLMETQARFESFRRLAAERFFKIDEELRDACMRLSRVGESLHLLVRMSENLETNVQR